MVRIKPYDSSSKSWNDILDKQLNIPMNQREYSWTDKELKQFINDIINIFEDKNLRNMLSKNRINFIKNHYNLPKNNPMTVITDIILR